MSLKPEISGCAASNGATADAVVIPVGRQIPDIGAWLVELSIRRRARSRFFDLALILAAAFALRLSMVLLFPNIARSDEVFQIVDPAYHALYGGQNFAWEWAVGLRSWVFPGLAAGLLELGRLLGLAPPFLGLPVTIFMALASLAPVACGYHWGRRIHGQAGALLTAGILAVWNDLVYFAPHSLCEVLAADLLVPALFLTYPAADIPMRRALAGGLLFGAALMLRLQLGPAILLAILVIGWRLPPRQMRLLATGLIIPVLLFGGLDWITYGVPFHSSIAYFRVNFLQHISANFGVSPWYEIFLMPALYWGWPGATAILLLAIAGAFRLPLLFAVAAAIFASHALVPHKEYRFIFPALPLLFTLCGIGSAEICGRLAHRFDLTPLRGQLLFAAAFGGWCVLSLSAALSPPGRFLWTRAAGDIAVMRLAATDPTLCGIGLLQVAFWELPGSAASPAGVPLYQIDPARLTAQSPGFNAILAEAHSPPHDARYSEVACFAHAGFALGAPARSICLWHRPGACAAGFAQPPQINWPKQLKPLP